jgi:tetratricopeptide (TPR) repeat protein
MEKKNNPIFKITCLIIFTTAISLLAHSAFAETKIFVKEYTYHASEEDSRNSSRTVSLREVKRLLLEELGTYLESITEVKSFHLTKDQIVTLTAGIVSAEVVEEKWDGKVYWLKARISADQDNVIKSIDKLRQDRQKVKELEEIRKRSEELLRENERLKEELAGKTGKKKKTAQAYQRNIENLTVAEWFEKGLASISARNWSDAMDAFNKCIELNPKYAEAYTHRGFVYGVLRNYAQAIEDCDRAIKLNPKNAEAYNCRGYSYGYLGNHNQEIKDITKAIQLSSKDMKWMYYYNRGLVYGELGNDQRAIKDYNKAIELDPKLELAYYNRGLAYAKLGNDQRAIKDFDRAIALNPQDAKAYYNRAFAYAMLGNYQQAIKDGDRAIELNPQDALAYAGRGLAYDELGDHQQAIQDLKIAARLGDETAQNLLRSQGIEW